MIRPKNETEGLLLSITKNCETLVEQTHTRPEETLEFKMNKPTELFVFTPPTQIKRDWMIGLTDLELYNSVFDITEELTYSNLTIFLMKKLLVFHMKKSEMRWKKTWMFQILQLPIYKTI